MKKTLAYSLWLLAPLALWAQASSNENTDVETSGVTVVENPNSETAVESPFESSNAISVDFPDEDVRTILRNIADIFELNLVIPETLQGRTSVKLRNVAWQQVFDVVLDPLGFTYVRDGNIVTVVENPNPETAVESPADEVVEIPDASIEGVSRDGNNSFGSETVQVLPEGTEVSMTLPGQATDESGQATRASEEKISVDFPDEDVRTILRNIADLFELNLVIPDTLQGRTSLKLRDITWQQAFDVVLEPLGFTYVGGDGSGGPDDNIIRIKSIEELTTEPVDTRVFKLGDARASEIQGSIAPLIDTAKGGKVQVDVRSNALVITERPTRMRKIDEIIQLLDKPTKQVMIETKFVEVSNIDDANLGVDWAFIDEGNVNKTILGETTRGTGFGDPGIGNTISGALAGNASDGLLAVFSEREFAMTLQALERKTESKLISNPTVVVLSNREATFQVGQDFPIREFNFNQQTGQVESGDLEYRETGIVLKVIPSVNKGMISLDIRPKIDRVSDRVVQGPNGIQDQIFDVRRVETQVTIKDGYTIALGGLAEDDKSESVSKVPLVGSLPVVGKLFSKTTVREDKRNLIIFLTAKILSEDGTTYREIISPRMLNDVGHTESVTPGYGIPETERDLLKQAEKARDEREATERESLLEMEVENPRAKGERTWQERINILNE